MTGAPGAARATNGAVMNDERGLLRELRGMLGDAGLAGAFLVRDLDTGEEIGIDPDVDYAAASLAKVPLAVAVLTRVHDGDLDGGHAVDIVPGRMTSMGPTGLSRFRHPARVAVDDLLYLSLAISDNGASDALFDLVPPEEVTAVLRAAGIDGITLRHRMQPLMETPTERFDPADVHLAHALAIGAGTAGRGHPLPQLDVTRASAGSARAFTALLAELWRPSRIPAPVAVRVRELMGQNLIRNRLTPDFASDGSTWSSKTGTLLNLRHEVGVVEHDDGGTYAVAALTESRVPASVQPAAEALMARVARALHDHLRSG